MTVLKFYLKLLSLLDSASKELGLDSLTESDRAVLRVLWEMAQKQGGEIELTYSDFLALQAESDNLSRAQYYKSLAALERHGLIKKVGGARSGRYAFANLTE
jgi:DNA-binding IscR family transcriptional regulator